MDLQFDTTEAFALESDQKDPLGGFRDRFYLPKQIYMDGNSLGLLSKDAEAALLRVIDEYKRLAIGGWTEPDSPWFTYGEKLGNMQADLVGAQPGEVVVHGSTTVNLHNLLATFFQPTQSRNKIVFDELNFPSDKYAVDSHLLLHSLNPDTHCRLIKSADGRTLRDKDIVAAMDDDVALVLLPSVLYRSGQLLDMPYLTQEAHKRDIIIGFDCCHSAGVVPHQLSQWDVDFAFWCNYKYLNNGPGGSASLYVNRKHWGKRPGLAGWWGSHKDTQFDMNLSFQGATDAGAWQIGTINLFSAAPLEGSLNIFAEAGIENIRRKSLNMTGYLMYLIDEILTQTPYNFSVGTPRLNTQRGGHVALEHPTEAIRINKALKERGVVPDFRAPNIIRLAPIALYNTYHEIWQVVQHLQDIIDTRAYAKFTKSRGVVA